MKTVEKDILYPGLYTLPGGERWECRERYIHEAAANGNKMLRAGNTAAPLCWGHNLISFPVPVPVLLSALSQKALEEYESRVSSKTFGWVNGYRVGVEKGEPVLYAATKIKRDADAEQYEQTRYVSPRVDVNFTDFNNRYWPGAVVTHVAATPIPIQMRQRPVMLSGATARAGGPNTSRSFVFLSSDPTYRGSPMADEKEGDKGGGGGGDMKRLKAALASHGIVIPDGANSLDDICLAVEAIGANTDAGSQLGDDLDDNPGDSENVVSPAMLSGMPKVARDALQKDIKATRKSLVKMVEHCRRNAVPALISEKRLRAIEATVTKADDSVMLSVAGGAIRSRDIFELQTVAGASGFKTSAAKVDESDPANSEPVETPRIGAGTSEEELAAVRERRNKRLGIETKTDDAKK